jgi:hypothetical protein
MSIKVGAPTFLCCDHKFPCVLSATVLSALVLDFCLSVLDFKNPGLLLPDSLGGIMGWGYDPEANPAKYSTKRTIADWPECTFSL